MITKQRLTKILDTKFNGSHPRGVNEGYSVEGFASKPSLGVSLRVYLEDESVFSTSRVTRVSGQTIHTMNSQYILEEVK